MSLKDRVQAEWQQLSPQQGEEDIKGERNRPGKGPVPEDAGTCAKSESRMA